MRAIFFLLISFLIYFNSSSQLQVTFDYTLPLCWGSPTGSITANASGGSGAYQYQWSTGDSLPTIDSIPGGLYHVTVTDQNLGTSTIESFFLNSPSPLNITSIIQHNLCYGVSQGSILVNIQGGTPPYSILWAAPYMPNLPPSPYITNLLSGNYIVNVTDANGCFLSESFYVQQLHSEQINPIFEVTPVSCRDGINDGRVIINDVYNITGTPVFVWNNDTITDSNVFDSIASGMHQLTIIDENGCTEAFSVHVPYLDKPCLIVYNAFTPNNDGFNDVWYIDNIHLFPRTIVRVWNLDGLLVFESQQGYPSPWDARYNNELLPPGTYYYEIDTQSPIYKPNKGFVKIEY